MDGILYPTRGFSGRTVRTFDVAAQRWPIYWLNSHTGTVFPPVHGRFADGRGKFHCEDVDDGRPVQVRCHDLVCIMMCAGEPVCRS